MQTPVRNDPSSMQDVFIKCLYKTVKCSCNVVTVVSAEYTRGSGCAWIPCCRTHTTGLVSAGHYSPPNSMLKCMCCKGSRLTLNVDGVACSCISACLPIVLCLHQSMRDSLACITYNATPCKLLLDIVQLGYDTDIFDPIIAGAY